jgi:hypothetical protein
MSEICDYRRNSIYRHQSFINKNYRCLMKNNSIFEEV